MRILELTLPSTNLSAQAETFGARLGFDVDQLNEDHLRIEAGLTRLNFVRSDRQYPFHYCFLIPPGSILSACQFLDERDFQPLLFNDQRVVDFGNGKAVYFYDGDNNIAEFIERPSLGHPEKLDFSIGDVIRINEIGLPAENPIEQAESLVRRYGIEFATDAVYREDFVWCGDYEGVFLIPRIGRHWMPTEIGAESNELSVRFETVEGQFELNLMNTESVIE